MHFLLTAAVTAALVFAESCPASPVDDAGARLFLIVVGIVLAAVAAHIAALDVVWRLQADPARHRTHLQRFRTLRRLHAAFWLIILAMIYYGFGWPRLVRFNWHLDGAFLLDDLLILTPVFLPLILSWAAFFEVERILHVLAGEAASGAASASRGRAANDGSPVNGSATRGDSSSADSRTAYVLVHIRHYCGLVLAPTLLFLAARDAAGLLPWTFGEGVWAGTAYAAAAVLMLIGFPVLLRYAWDTRSLPAGPLRTRLEAAAARHGFRARDILVWRTNGLLVNAAVTGATPSFRYVFLSDGLLQHLAPEEIEAVFAHEIGHLRHRHLWLRLAAVSVPLGVCFLLQAVCPGVTAVWKDVLMHGEPVVQAVAVVSLVCALASYMLLVFGPYCRLLEGQADLFGCRASHGNSEGGMAENFISALENLALAAGIDRNTPTWQHASIARRIDFLKRAAQDPESELHFQRKVRWLSGLILATVLSPLAFQLLRLS